MYILGPRKECSLPGGLALNYFYQSSGLYLARQALTRDVSCMLFPYPVGVMVRAFVHVSVQTMP